MTDQETFDKVVGHARNQRCRATENDGCKYRMEGGLMCFAGVLIPDDQYTLDLEGLSTSDLDGMITPVGSLMKSLGHNTKLVSELQIVHDTGTVRTWDIRLAKVALRFGLDYTPQEIEEVDD